jgi:hypothetical protein
VAVAALLVAREAPRARIMYSSDAVSAATVHIAVRVDILVAFNHVWFCWWGLLI